VSTPMLVVRLFVEPATVSGDSELSIRGDVLNSGVAEVDTRTHASVLLVDGEPAENWPLAIGNGIRDARELALPPGERIEFERRLPASSVLRRQGSHELILMVEGFRSPAVTIQWH
jgi:hypothetical protein